MFGNVLENGFNCCYDVIILVKVIIYCYIWVIMLKWCNYSYYIVKIL